MSADLKKMPPQEEVVGSKIELRMSSGTVICLNFSEKDEVLPKIVRLIDPDTDLAVVFRSEDGVYHELDSDSASNLQEFQHINHCHHCNCDDGNEQSQNSNADARKNDERLEKQREKLQKKLRQRKASNKEDENCNGHCHQVIQLPIKGLTHYVRVNSPGCMNGESKTNPSKDETTLDSEPDKVPQYISARGEQATAAYQRALKFGKTKDKRVKIYVIGKDRAGKTSLVRSLKGEPFRKNEVSTNGVEMSQPLMNADEQPWKNGALPEDTTVYHHRFAECINRDLASQEESVKGLAADYAIIKEDTTSSFKEEELEEREIPHKIAKLEEAVEEEEEKELKEKPIPPEIRKLVLEQNSSRTSDGIWPVIWDFAGQSIFRAIHPIFMSLAAVYILVFDLTQELSATAQCHVREEGYDDVEIPAPDSNDTNFDHTMRWLDLAHSFSEDDETLPAVLLVGTHADAVIKSGDHPEKRMDAIINTIVDSAEIFTNHIRKTFTIDNTTQEDPIVNLRKEIINVAEKLPHTKDDVPLIWLEVEDAVYNQVSQGEKYMTRQKFKRDIADNICNFEREDDFEVLLQFLHDRGTIVYHYHVENPDGLVVLDPQWLVNVICKIITTDTQRGETPLVLRHRRVLAKRGILSAKLLDLSCKAHQLEDIQHSLLFILKKFNLLCEWKHKVKSRDYLVPCMLTQKPEGNLIDPSLKHHEPVCITFSTNYVPCGLFSRLLVFFWEWAASKTCNYEEQQLFANAASFVIGENTCAAFVCCKTVIKIYILVIDKSKPVDKDVCLELPSVLKNRLDELKKECHWLRAVTWELCGQCSCKQCPKKVNTKTGKCFRHQEKECSDDDCAHYVPVTRKPFVCRCGRVFPVPNTWVQGLSPSIVIDSSQDEPAQGKPVKSDTALRVTLLASEWSSSMGGLSTINRQLATLLAKHKQVEVTLLVPQSACSEEEKRAARSRNVAIREAERHPGYDPLDWLSFPPKDLAIDIVLGHGGKLGKQAQIIRKSHNCKWVQVVHTAPEELGMHKNYPKAISKGEEKNRTEIDLCKLANLVVAVGPKLAEAYSSYLRSCKQDQDIIQLTPGTFDEFSDVKQATHESDKFKVLTFGRGDPEDFNLKGYDIAAKAIVELKDRCYRLIFVGAPEGKQDEVADNLLKSGISKDQLTVRKFVTSKERLKELFCEADIAIMPSRTEGFGLTALEALSAGLPILVSGNSGFGDALRSLPLGKPLVVDSADPKEWAKAIRAVHLKNRAKRLEEIQRLRTCYEEKYSWEKQCEDLVGRMWRLVHAHIEEEKS